jgi:hypothetical protein
MLERIGHQGLLLFVDYYWIYCSHMHRLRHVCVRPEVLAEPTRQRQSSSSETHSGSSKETHFEHSGIAVL